MDVWLENIDGEWIAVFEDNGSRLTRQATTTEIRFWQDLLIAKNDTNVARRNMMFFKRDHDRLVENETEMLAGLADLREELRVMTQRAGNLLARIHRDGGHYVVDHGWDKACEDAETIVCKLIHSDEQRRSERESLRARLRRILGTAREYKSWANLIKGK